MLPGGGVNVILMLCVETMTCFVISSEYVSHKTFLVNVIVILFAVNMAC